MKWSKNDGLGEWLRSEGSDAYYAHATLGDGHTMLLAWVIRSPDGTWAAVASWGEGDMHWPFAAQSDIGTLTEAKAVAMRLAEDWTKRHDKKASHT